jgi:hypothetical protein
MSLRRLAITFACQNSTLLFDGRLHFTLAQQEWQHALRE